MVTWVRVLLVRPIQVLIVLTRGPRNVLIHKKNVYATLATRAQTAAHARHALLVNTKARPVRTRARGVREGRPRIRRV